MKVVEHYRPILNKLRGNLPPDLFFGRLRCAAMYSGCQKSQRGALLLLPNRNEYVGCNRPVVGFCDNSATCRADCARICIHAEQAALLRAGSDVGDGEMFHLHVVDGEPVPSDRPSCVECSKLMLAAGVAGMWLYQADGWRRWTTEEFHRETLRTLGLHGCLP